MVGLPFPNNGAGTREPSWDDGTPFSNSGDIPIDPALSEPPLDPALLIEDGVVGSTETPQPPPLYPHYELPRAHQYPQGPQGDPFAQPPPVYIPVEEPVPLPAKPPKKRKRPVAREEECGFCSGNDTRNKFGQPELMVSCVDCGRSGHPSCMGLDGMGDAMRSYDWQCATCKSCSVCRRKGNEASMLICDFCDRGWHMSCFDPPFREPPAGRWHCPYCPPVDSVQFTPDNGIPEQSPESPEIHQPFLSLRESSVASSSHYLPPSSDIPDIPDHPLTTDASEVDIDIAGLTPRKRSKGKRSRRGRESTRDEDVVRDQSVETPMPTIRRLRIRVSSPAPQATENETPTLRLRVPARGKGKARDDAPEESGGLFDDLLSVEDRDVRDTAIRDTDQFRFTQSRSNAESKTASRPPPPPEPPETPIAGPSTRPLRSHATSIAPQAQSSSMSPAPSAATPGPNTAHPNGLRIRKIRFGEYDIDTWYDAPFPEEYATIPDGRLWMCEYCLKYLKSQFSAIRHQLKCKVRHPPGDEIYRDGRISIFEVDGRKNKIYCQNLCLLSKMFLDHKSLFYDVEPFLFYVMTETDEDGAHFVGYFSKEKLSPKNYNVSCIMTLPVRQRQGWGNLLIDFSYLLSKKERRAGSPEKPLSALGALGYRNYWTLSLMRYLQTAPPNPSLEDISVATSMTLEDIYSTLVQLNMISVLDSAQAPKPLPGQTIKFPKGRKNGIARKHLQRTQTHDDEKPKGPFVPPTRYKVRWDADQVEEYLVRWEAKGYLKLKPEQLKWSPFILSRAKKTQGEVDLGEGTRDGTRSMSADVQPSESSGFAADSSNEAHIHVEKTRSPAFALFDDDNIEVIRASASRNPASPDAAEADGSHVWPVERTPRKRNKTRNVDDRPSTRRLRTRDLVSESTPARRRLQTPRREASSQSERHRNSTRSHHDVISTPVSQSNFNGAPTPSLDDDAALASRLAMELDQPRRQLRTRRPSSDQQTQLPLQKRLASTPRSVSPRKRRRVDSSPEVETTPAPRSSVLRRSSRNGESPLPREKPAIGTPQRKSSRLANGRSSVMNSAIMALREEEEEEELPEINGTSAEANNDAIAEPEAEDTKYDDADTPVTGATAASRHSVPSDDTTIGGDTARSKVSPFPRISEALSPLSVLAQVAGQVAEAALDDGGDEDAEGEDDVDAEGEPDDDDAGA